MYHHPSTDNINVLVKQYIAIFFAHLWVVIAIVMFALAIGITSAITSPDQFTSTTTVNFDLKNTNPFSGGGAVDGSFIATQVDLIKSKTVAQRVVDDLNDDDFERVKFSIWNDYTLFDSIIGWFLEQVDILIGKFAAEEEGFSESFVESSLTNESAAEPGIRPKEYSWMTKSILSRLVVVPVIGSSNITLKYVSTDPYVAALVVNQIASEFAAYSVERGTKPAERTREWLDSQLEVLRTNLEDSQRRLTVFQQENGIVADEGKLNIEEIKLQQLTTQLGDQQQQAKALESRWLQIKASKGEVLNSLPQIVNDPVVQNIKADIRRLEGQLTEVSSKFGENHPQYKTVVAELRASRNKLNREIRSVAAGAEKEAKLAKKTEVTLEQALNDQKNLVLKLKTQMNEVSVLQREVDSQQQTYNAALTQYNQSSLRSLVSQASVNVVDFATPPNHPSGPSIVKNILASFVLGFVMAVGIVFLKEFFGRKIRCKEDMLMEENVHFLGVIQ